MADPGISGVAEGPGFHSPIQQGANEGLAYGTEGTVDNGPAELKRFIHPKNILSVTRIKAFKKYQNHCRRNKKGFQEAFAESRKADDG